MSLVLLTNMSSILTALFNFKKHHKRPAGAHLFREAVGQLRSRSM